MPYKNRAIILGHVGRDPEVRHTTGGSPIVQFSIATSERRKDQSVTTWHNIVVFNEHLGEIAQKYVRKGSLVEVQGQIQHRDWVDKDGVKRTSTEIVLGKFRGELLVFDKREAAEPAQGGPIDDSDAIPF